MANEKRLVNAEAISRKLKNAYCAECNVVRKIQCSACWVEDVLELLEGDTVDAVEVVRCKDCVNYCGFEHCKNGICDVDSISKRAVYPNDFCSYGERKDNV